MKPPAMFAGGFFIAILHRAPFGACGILISWRPSQKCEGFFLCLNVFLFAYNGILLYNCEQFTTKII